MRITQPIKKKLTEWNLKVNSLSLSWSHCFQSQISGSSHALNYISKSVERIGLYKGESLAVSDFVVVNK